ncbi:MAG: GNAT family N-acetyltransferase [Pseudomonadota bacterium]
MTDAPVIETERLVLRGHRQADFAAYAEFYASDRAEFVGGPVGPAQAWRFFAGQAGHWVLMGFGWWMIEAEGRPIGMAGLHRPPHYPELEIGWTVFAGGEGHGYAQEAASAALAWGWRHVRPESLVSYIEPGNNRSVRLAERLGASRDDAATKPAGEPDLLVYRHAKPEQAAA